MIGMCDRRSQARNDKERRSKLGNVMFILSFAPMVGQIRHIDSTDPNLQVCLYMSADCPSTIVYSLDEDEDHELIKYWEVCNQEVTNLNGGRPFPKTKNILCNTCSSTESLRSPATFPSPMKEPW